MGKYLEIYVISIVISITLVFMINLENEILHFVIAMAPITVGFFVFLIGCAKEYEQIN